MVHPPVVFILLIEVEFLFAKMQGGLKKKSVSCNINEFLDLFQKFKKGKKKEQKRIKS